METPIVYVVTDHYKEIVLVSLEESEAVLCCAGKAGYSYIAKRMTLAPDTTLTLTAGPITTESTTATKYHHFTQEQKAFLYKSLSRSLDSLADIVTDKEAFFQGFSKDCIDTYTNLVQHQKSVYNQLLSDLQKEIRIDDLDLLQYFAQYQAEQKAAK